MAEVKISISGREYSIACKDSEVDKVRLCAAQIQKRVESLSRSLGSEAGHARLLLMAGILVAEDLMELREDAVPGQDKSLIEVLDRATARVEKLTRRLQSTV